jgi:glucan biosynthesis protein C
MMSDTKATARSTGTDTTLNNSTKGARLAYLDNYRIFLIILVVLHHTSMAYGGNGTWAIMQGATDPISPPLIALFNSVNQAFFMSAFFFLAGYFSPRSLERKGRARFLLDRLIRLGVPVLVFTLLVVNLNQYILASFVPGRSFRWFVGYSPDHLWFLQDLAVFAVLYVVINWIVHKAPTRPTRVSSGRFPKDRALIGLIGVLTVLTFLIRIPFPVNKWVLHMQIGHVVHYLFAFFLGTLAYRGDWLNGLSRAQGRKWGWVALAMVPAFYGLFIAGGMLEDETVIVRFMGGLDWRAFGYALWDSVMMIAMNVWLLHLFRRKANRQSNLTRRMAASVFTVYIIHTTVLFFLQGALYGIELPSMIKFVIVGITAVPIVFLVASGIRLIPGTRRVLG